MAASIVYKDIAPGADAASSYSATDKTAESTLALSNPIGGKYATLEPNRWTLSGDFEIYDSDPVIFWSSSFSDANGDFSTPPVLTITLSAQFTAPGITITFDEETGEYASDITIQWYQGATLKDTQNCNPDSTVFVLENQVTSFDKVVITFNSTSLPKRRLRVTEILMGIVRIFGADEIMSANCLNEMDLLSAELPASSMSAVINSATPVDYMFQQKQPIEVRNGTDRYGVYYLKAARRKTTTMWELEAQDAIGALDDQMFDGAAYLSATSAKTIFTNIVNGAFPIVWDASVTDTTLKGILVRQTKREAMQQVLFAWGVCCRTDGSGNLVVFVPNNTPTVITEDETYVGASVVTDPIVTKVNVIAHTYATNTNGDILIGSTRYRDTQTVYSVTNPDVTANDVENVKEVKEATLVSTANGQAVAQRVYDYYTRQNTHQSKIVYSGQKLGDCLTQPTPWGTTETGNVIQLNIILSNLIAADVVSVGVEQ